ncbi:hypothetical protein AKJ16_DCAP20411 [Drosera capensis]
MVCTLLTSTTTKRGIFVFCPCYPPKVSSFHQSNKRTKQNPHLCLSSPPPPNSTTRGRAASFTGTLLRRLHLISGHRRLQIGFPLQSNCSATPHFLDSAIPHLFFGGG